MKFSFIELKDLTGSDLKQLVHVAQLYYDHCQSTVRSMDFDAAADGELHTAADEGRLLMLEAAIDTLDKIPEVPTPLLRNLRGLLEAMQ